MAFATARTVALIGARGHLIDVQVDVSPGVVNLAMVGRVDSGISEARDRCRTATTNSGFDWPTTRRITVSLAPADLPKRGPHFDLAIAVAVIAAGGHKIPADALERSVLLGELTLTGGLRPVTGVLPMTLAASRAGIDRVFVPEPQAAEAALVPGMSVFGVRSLAQVIAELCGVEVPDAPPVLHDPGGALVRWRGEDRLAEMDLADLIGMRDTRYAVEVAAAGGHHLLLSGPKGAGKTSIAERIPSILPDLTTEESLEVTAVRSLAGGLGETGLVKRPPFFAPHHTSSRVSLLGGGSGKVRPGELSKAHAGVLLLDEFPLFNLDILEALRQPLESGEVTIARGEETATYPAGCMFVLACNPCPCGGYAPHPADDTCTCTEVRRRDYRRKLSGPLVDRIDITRHVMPVQPREARDPLAQPESSATVAARIAAARTRQAHRHRGRGWRLNGQVPGPVLRAELALAPEAERLLDDEMYAGRLTRRGATRVHRLAWTVADLAEVARPGPAEVEVAMALRMGAPLRLDHLQARS